ncbi:MAG: heat shock protein HspQ [Phycisphaerales bacterium JB038]
MIMLSASRAQRQTDASQRFFAPGRVVRHKRYGYRGVIVEADSCCLADDAWYYSNATQPERNQPWYHVLVDETVCMTYAAEENLVPDDSKRPVTHPLVKVYFERFANGRYIRNNQPFQKGC